MKENVSRRQFLHGVGAAGILAAGVGLAGCSPSQQSAGQAPVDAEGGPLSSTGTMTADLSQQQWSFEIPPEPIPDSDIAETIEADVVVVGAGTSGLMAANSAMDAGLKVCLISASSKNVARGGSNQAIMSKTKERLGIPKTDPALFEREIISNGLTVDQKKWYKFYNNSEEAMNWLIDFMESKGYETGIETPPELIEGGNYYSLVGAHGWMTPDFRELGLMQQYVVDELADRLREGGMGVYYKNIGRQLIREDNNTGRVTAIVAEREDGTYAKYVGSKAIILATGDFSTDREMMYKYAPATAAVIEDEIFEEDTDYDRDLFYGGLYPGDGQKMGLWIGAAWQRNYPCCPMGAAVDAGPRPGTSSFAGLKVNRFGQRYCNEYGMRDMAGYVNRFETNGEVYALWNEDYIRNYPFKWVNTWIPYGEDATVSVDEVLQMWEEDVENGRYVKADTIEELVEKLELPKEALDSVARYNELCASGADTDFYKDSRFMISLEKGPFYGQKSSDPKFLTILGGLRTNDNMQVCNEDDEPIPGLYNVGTMVGDMYNVNYTFQIPGLNLGSTCITFGYLVGKYIAENE